MNTIKINVTKGKLLNDLRKIYKLIKNSKDTDLETVQVIKISGKKGNDYITFTGCDGFTLSNINLNTVDKLNTDILGYVDKDSFNDIIELIQRNKARGGDNLEITGIDKGNISFCGNGWKLNVINCFDVDYFDTDGFFNNYDKHNDYITINTSEFKKALKQLADNHCHGNRYAIAIKNDPYDKKFILESTFDHKTINIDVKGQNDNNDFNIRGFNPRFLFNAINDTGKKTECKLCFCDPSKAYDPVKILENGNQHLVLPVKLNV